MKSGIVLAISLVFLVAASPLERRQQGGFMSIVLALIPDSYKLAPLSIQELPPKIRKGAIRKVARYGPFILPPNKDGIVLSVPGGHSHSEPGSMDTSMNPQAQPTPWQVVTGALSTILAQKPMDPNGFSVTRIFKSGSMCTDCTVLGGKMTVVFENGSRADVERGVYLHHAISIDFDKQQQGWVTPCPKNGSVADTVTKQSVGGIFIGGAVDDFTQLYTTPDGKFQSGYYVGKNDFAMQAEMINYRKEEQKVYMQIDLEYVPGKQGGEAQQSVLSAVGCDGNLGPWKPADNTRGAVATDGFQVYRNGHIVLARGHMHDGGTGINMYLNGKLYCTSKAIYGGPSGTLNANGQTWISIATMTECNDPIAVKKGDRIKIEATYDTKEHPLRESHGVKQENMGMMTMVFAPSDLS